MDVKEANGPVPFPCRLPPLRRKSTKGIGGAQEPLSASSLSGPTIQRRGGDSNPRTRLTPVTRFPVAPVQPLRHLSWSGARVAWRGVSSPFLRHGVGPRAPGRGGRGPDLDLPPPVAQQRDLVAIGQHPGYGDLVAPDHEIGVDDAVVG